MAAATPSTLAGALHVLDHIKARRLDRQATVLAAAAAQAGVDTDDLVRRLQDDPEREELVNRTLQAVGEAAGRERLVAYAVALARATLGDIDEVAWEATFVRALEDLEPNHLALLDQFTQTGTQLGLVPPGTVPDPKMHSLNEQQVQMVSKASNLPAFLAVLQRHGLLASGAAQGGMSFMAHWHVTSFGLAFLDRLRIIGEALAEARPSD